MRRVIGIDVHRTFGEVVTWENGVLRHAGRVDMTGTALEGLGKSLRSTDEVVIEATGNGMAVSRVLTAFVARVIIASFGKRGKTGGGMNLRFTGGHELDSFWECCRPPTSMAYRTPI